jgi:hypothetical protein
MINRRIEGTGNKTSIIFVYKGKRAFSSILHVILQIEYCLMNFLKNESNRGKLSN